MHVMVKKRYRERRRERKRATTPSHAVQRGTAYPLNKTEYTSTSPSPLYGHLSLLINYRERESFFVFVICVTLFDFIHDLVWVFSTIGELLAFEFICMCGCVVLSLILLAAIYSQSHLPYLHYSLVYYFSFNIVFCQLELE